MENLNPNDRDDQDAEWAAAEEYGQRWEQAEEIVAAPLVELVEDSGVDWDELDLNDSDEVAEIDPDVWAAYTALEKMDNGEMVAKVRENRGYYGSPTDTSVEALVAEMQQALEEL